MKVTFGNFEKLTNFDTIKKMNYSYEIFKFDKDCFGCSTYLNIFFACLLLILQIFNHLCTSKSEIIAFSIIMLFYIGFIIKKYELLQKIKKQTFRKIIIENNNDITLYDNNDNIIKINQQRIVSNKISRIGLGTFCILPFPYHTYWYSCSIVKLGDIEIITDSGEKYNIIISDIENFITNSIYQNVTNTTIY